MLTTAELNALPYAGGTASSQGLTADDYRALYRVYGEPVRWWKALPVPAGTPGRERNGYHYEEQELDSVIRVMIYQNRREMRDTAFGTVASGQSMISVIPDEIQLARGDRVLGMERLQRARTRMRRDSGPRDVLSIRHAVQLAWVVGAERTYVIGVDVALSNDGNSIEWLNGGGAPEAGEEYGIEWTYRPIYTFLGQMSQEPRRGTDGKFLPQVGLLHQGETLPI